MSEPFLSEIKMVGFNFAPRGWAFCDGQILPINQNQALFSLLGTMYGGNGQTNFALPDLRGRVAVHAGKRSDSEDTVEQGQKGPPLKKGEGSTIPATLGVNFAIALRGIFPSRS